MGQNITEEILIEFLECILDLEEEISLTDFKKRVRHAFDLSDYDLSISSTRPNECMYEQRCRNIICHNSLLNKSISYKNGVFKRI